MKTCDVFKKKIQLKTILFWTRLTHYIEKVSCCIYICIHGPPPELERCPHFQERSGLWATWKKRRLLWEAGMEHMSQLFKSRHELLLSAGRTATKRGNSVAPRVLVPLLHSRVAKSKEELEWRFWKDLSLSKKWTKDLLNFSYFSSINYHSQ